MKKINMIAALCGVVAFCVVGCSGQDGSAQNAPAEKEESAQAQAGEESAQAQAGEGGASAAGADLSYDLGDKKDFIVGFDADFPPYGYVDDNGQYVGFDLDLAKEAASRLGLEVKYQPIQWDSKDMELDSGAIDCIWNGFTMSEERLDAYEWTEPYVDNSQVVVVSADSGIKTLADLAGKVLCVQADSSALEAIESEDHADLYASLAELMQVPDYNTAFMNLESGAVDAVAMDVGVAKYQIESRGTDFVILDEKLVSELYGVGFKKGNVNLRNAIQSAMNDMAADGKMLEIATTWGQQDTLLMGK